jgi:hypothetical protein
VLWVNDCHPDGKSIKQIGIYHKAAYGVGTTIYVNKSIAQKSIYHIQTTNQALQRISRVHRKVWLFKLQVLGWWHIKRIIPLIVYIDIIGLLACLYQRIYWIFLSVSPWYTRYGVKDEQLQAVHDVCLVIFSKHIWNVFVIKY